MVAIAHHRRTVHNQNEALAMHVETNQGALSVIRIRSDLFSASSMHQLLDTSSRVITHHIHGLRSVSQRPHLWPIQGDIGPSAWQGIVHSGLHPW